MSVNELFGTRESKTNKSKNLWKKSFFQNCIKITIKLLYKNIFWYLEKCFRYIEKSKKRYMRGDFNLESFLGCNWKVLSKFIYLPSPSLLHICNKVSSKSEFPGSWGFLSLWFSMSQNGSFTDTNLLAKLACFDILYNHLKFVGLILGHPIHTIIGFGISHTRDA